LGIIKAAKNSQRKGAKDRKARKENVQKERDKQMNLTLRIWRQKNSDTAGQFVEYKADDVSPDMSFLEMLDVVNEGLIKRGDEPIAFDHDCREGICGTCGMVINGVAHGPLGATTTCQLHMRHFKDGQVLTIEPWRARPFPVIKDLVVDRGSFDRVIQAGGFISARTGGAPDGNAIPISKPDADLSMDAAACIGCGACVAACKNASAMLFVAAKVSHLNILPQGKPEKERRVLNMVRAMDEEGFGNCTVMGSCEAVCPKEISLDFISRMNRDYLKALLRNK
jgi:succinate dehydrogenase / fumarate reductase iron-sulfur subunit